MLSRLRLDNFRCFVDFEFEPKREQLIFGANGTGKSSLLDALQFVRSLTVRGQEVPDLFFHRERTRWLNSRAIRIGLEVDLPGGTAAYELEVIEEGQTNRARISKERMLYSNSPLLECENGQLRLSDDNQTFRLTYDYDPLRSALYAVIPRSDSKKLTQFKSWLTNLNIFRLNPFQMGRRAESEQAHPELGLGNFAAWYRHLVQADPEANNALFASLREAIDDFSFLNYSAVGENISLLMANFRGGLTLGFDQLSEGQRCLICLYTILHFVIAKGGCVILDEPENFLALREIQPWLLAAAEAAEDSGGQILLISHHPEIINLWAPAQGVMLVRDGVGAVRGEQLDSKTYSMLTPAEVLARGWERE